ncbi:MAG: hypothetical protein M3Y07_15210 [Acidobacteriota bacterium]|nr:hypothetical protein [Acidobacteriota bacterium]
MKQNKPTLSEGINGSWLIAVVATQEVANLSLLLLPELEAYRPLLSPDTKCQAYHPWVHPSWVNRLDSPIQLK